MLKTFLKNSWFSLRVLARMLLAGIILLGAVVWLGSKFWLLPEIERYHDDITLIASQAAGSPVVIGKITGDWHGIRPRLSFADVRVLDKQGRATLTFQRIENVLSWQSLLVGELRLHSLAIEQPNLRIRRDKDGNLHVADVAVTGDDSEAVADSSLTDWVLNQSRIVVRDARISWRDEMNAAPTLILKKVNLLIDNDGSEHRFALRAEPPAKLSSSLDVRGDFQGNSFVDFKAWHGQLYMQINHANVPAWKPWLPALNALKRGEGGLRGWMQVREGQVSQMTVDLALTGVQTQLADDLLPLDVLAMRGRLVWQNVSNGFEIALQKFSLQLKNGLDVQPTDFYLRLANATDSKPASGEVRADSLELLGLASLADFLPVGSGLRQQLFQFAPGGQVSNLRAKWQGSADNLQQFEVNAHFANLALRRVGRLPGFSGLSGSINGNMGAGTLLLNSTNLKVDAPEFMAEPLQFDLLAAKSSWKKNEQGYLMQFDNVVAENEDAAGTAAWSLQTVANGPGVLDLNVHLTRAKVRHAARYTPLIALDGAGREWLKNALLDGQSDDFRLALRGNLKDFPFAEKDTGLFEIKARATGGVVEYMSEWPRVEQGLAEFSMVGKRLETMVLSATSVGGNLHNVSVVVPDITSPHLLLQIRGEATGETSRFLEFIRKSPVRGYIEGASDHFSARGNGKLALSLDLPLSTPIAVETISAAASVAAPLAVSSVPATPPIAVPATLPADVLKVAGTYQFLDNEVTIPGGLVAQQANGSLSFTESSLHTKDVTAHILGGPAKLVLSSKQGKPLRAKVQGVANIDEFRASTAYPLLNNVHGSSPWEANITIRDQQANVQLSSNLRGIKSDLPAPFTKKADELTPLHFELQHKGEREVITVQYGKLLDAKLLLREKQGEWVVRSGNIHFSEASDSSPRAPSTQQIAARRGIWVTGAISELAAQDWADLFTGSSGAATGSSGAPLAIEGADLLIRKINGYGYAAQDVQLKVATPRNSIVAQLAAPTVNGEVKWQPEGKGKLTVRLSSLTLQKDPVTQINGAQAVAADAEVAQLASSMQGSGTFPTIDMEVEKFAWKNTALGKLELLVNKQKQDWLIERFRLSTPEGVVAGDAKWHNAASAEQTQVNMGLDIYNSGSLLTRLGYPESVKDGKGRLEGSFSWQGSPQAFSFAALDGSMKLKMGKGQFLQVDPGIGKLLSVFSLQALPKRITLDFTDVFSAGFKFDKIDSTAQIRQGLMQVNDFKIEGSAAKVTMRGQVDLIQETQDLRVRILPTVGDTVSLLSFVAGPIVGVSVLLANKILRNPLDKLVSFEYNIDGTWDAPNVVKLGVSQGAGDAGENFMDETIMSPDTTKPLEATPPLEIIKLPETSK